MTESAHRETYSDAQIQLIGVWLFDHRNRLWLEDEFPGESGRYIPSLLVGVCLWDMMNKPLSATEALDIMQVKHGKTGKKYIDIAVELNLIKLMTSKYDKRKTILKPTDALLKRFRREIARIADKLRDLLAALMKNSDSLPDNGAPKLALVDAKVNQTYYIDRLKETAEKNPKILSTGIAKERIMD